MTVWINGTLLPDSEARISVFDHGLVVGDGVFETIKVIGGVPFAVTRHLARLAQSAAGMGLPEPDLDEIAAGTLALLEASGRPATGRMRLTLTAGVGPLGSQRGNAPAYGYHRTRQPRGPRAYLRCRHGPVAAQ